MIIHTCITLTVFPDFAGNCNVVLSQQEITNNVKSMLITMFFYWTQHNRSGIVCIQKTCV